MTRAKRLLDLGLVCLLAPIIVLILLPVCLWLWARQGRPIFFGSERMASITHSFTLWKLRTMSLTATDSGVSGGDKAARITPAGRVLRRSRLDEMPQILNILCGDISFVGPRPPLRQYVELYPELYAQVLRSQPGVTGLASLVYAAHEARLLARAGSPQETHHIYANRCVPRKAKLDLIYQRRRTLRLDLWLILVTAVRFLGRAKGRRLPRCWRDLLATSGQA
jgi:lipopolysaccharide/colanic/teichoic acid biosynthesis glycosyltransferase